MKTKLAFLLLIFSMALTACSPAEPASAVPLTGLSSAGTPAQSTAAPAGLTGAGQDGQRRPPDEAFSACQAKTDGQTCQFTSPKGAETGTCKAYQTELACAPEHNKTDAAGKPQGPQQGGGENLPAPVEEGGGQGYNIEQATSDKAQGMTISYDALAFLTGDLGADSFFPPGKLADFWGFQHLRDNDPSQMGHAGEFLTSAAMNTLTNLTADQRAQLVALAASQVDQINEYGYKRFVLMDAFRRQLEGDLPAGTTGLDLEAVKAYSADLYRLDGQISYDRARLMGGILAGLSAEQKAYFDAMVGKGMKEWPAVEEPADIRGLERDVKVAVMTYAADTYSWYAGSVEADVYFCPERHGTYFGSFYLKDIKAMGDPTYAIPTNLTGDLGEVLLQKLTPDQASQITSLVDLQKPALQGIVDTREQISIELRKFKDGSSADQARVLALMEQYGSYDGEIIYLMAAHFANVGKSLTDAQRAELDSIRAELLAELSHPTGAYLYSQAVPMPQIPSSDFLFQ